MDLTKLNDLKSFLGKFGFRLTKKFGQNFLIDRSALEKIVDAAELKQSDQVLEIGPGVGTLTGELASRVDRVVAIEKDKKLNKLLQISLKDFSNIEIIFEDALKIKFSKIFPEGNYKVVANIPYYITGEILEILLSAKPRPSVIVLLVQKEVAERITAGDGQQTILSLSVKFFGQPRMIGVVEKESFFPEPQVDSAVLRIDTYQKPILNISEKEFFRLIKIGFSSKRKTLLNNLSAGLKIEKEEVRKVFSQLDLLETVRAQELSLQDWGRLEEKLSAFKL